MMPSSDQSVAIFKVFNGMYSWNALGKVENIPQNCDALFKKDRGHFWLLSCTSKLVMSPWSFHGYFAFASHLFHFSKNANRTTDNYALQPLCCHMTQFEMNRKFNYFLGLINHKSGWSLCRKNTIICKTKSKLQNRHYKMLKPH